MFLVFFSYAIVTTDKVTLFVESEQLGKEAREYLGEHVEIQPYGSFFNYLNGLAGTLELNEDSVSDPQIAVRTKD